MPSLTVTNLSKTYPNGYTALREISFSVPEGQLVCVVGRSGAGKSTLLKCLNGSVPITSGNASVAGIDVRSVDASQRRALQRAVGFVYQEFQLVGRLNALQNVLTGRLGHVAPWRSALMLFSAHDRQIALDGLDRVGMLHKAMQRTDSLSGGEKQRVAIGRALAQEPSVLLADEPVANLDPELAVDVLRDLRRAAAELGVTTLINIHNVAQAMEFADRIIGIAEGVVVFDGPPAQFDRAALDTVYRFDRRAMEADPEDALPLLLPDLDEAPRPAAEREGVTLGARQ